jgi:hypothetical protein|tara:strand:+ start:1757 stop:1996 length:240 start_codon:yes stop_codon:yes gene_type:complete
MKVDFNNLASVITIGLLCWGALQLYQLKADTAVITYRVGANYDMIKPMWQDFLVRSAKYNEHKQNINAVPDIHATRGEK